MDDVFVEVNCVTGEKTVRPLTADEAAAFRRRIADAESTAAAAEQAGRAQLAQARKVLADNPDLATVLRALGLSLPADTGELRGEVR
jgi:hypothetical protein